MTQPLAKNKPQHPLPILAFSKPQEPVFFKTIKIISEVEAQSRTGYKPFLTASQPISQYKPSSRTSTTWKRPDEPELPFHAQCFFSMDEEGAEAPEPIIDISTITIPITTTESGLSLPDSLLTKKSSEDDEMSQEIREFQEAGAALKEILLGLGLDLSAAANPPIAGFATQKALDSEAADDLDIAVPIVPPAVTERGEELIFPIEDI